jgi:cytochrome P450 family 114
MEPENLRDPHPYLAWVRENVPVHRHPSGFYVVSRHADVRWIVRSPLMRGPEADELARKYPRALAHRAVRLLVGTIAMENPPHHTRIRRLISRDFTVARVEALRPGIEEMVEGLLDAVEEPLRDGAVVDLHRHLSLPVSNNVIAELLGVPPADRPPLIAVVVRTLQAMDAAATPAQLDDADDASQGLEDYFARLIAERRRNPGDDLVSALITGRPDADGLDEDELMSMVWGLWSGGFESTAAALDNAILTLLAHPGQAHRLAGGPKEVKAFVNEALRYDSPVTVSGVVRIPAEPVVVGGVEIPADVDVRVMLGAANRDPEAFPDPDRFDPTRNTTASLGFGGGIHYCLGAALAQVEIASALTGLHRRLPGLALAAEPRRRRAVLPLRACETLPVRLAA